MAYSIVIVTWECAGHLAALVDSMNRHLASRPEGPSKNTDPELVVVDNASADDPESAVRRWRGPARFLRLESNRGYGTAANAGVEAASGEAIVTLNPDTELLDGRLDALAAFALERGALAGPRLLNPGGSPQPSANGPVVGPWPWVGALLPGAAQPSRMQEHTEPWRAERTTRVTWLSGACVAGPRELMRALGPFDPAIHLYGEDMDLGLRAAAAGAPSYFCPDVCALVHHGRGSTSVRWRDGPARAIEANWRSVARRAYGARRERRAWRARKLHFALRAAAKSRLRGDPDWDRALLAAARAARPAELPERPEAGQSLR